MSRRDNGRGARSWHPLADLDPQLADAVLDLLADEGIAAYAAPVSDHRALMDLPARVVDRPLDRVYVDAEALARARGVVDEALAQLRADMTGAADAAAGATGVAAEEDPLPPPGGGSVDEDTWAALVAAFHASDAEAVRRWPADEDLPAPEGPGSRAGRGGGSGRGPE
ncbi:MAG: hypothetical protein M3Q27_10345, partial [Actinomycetota bacterium]|nr:hypothetical protein [Actinomycetota bacterium]